MIPVLLAADGADATPYIISGLSACVAFLAGLVATIAMGKASSLTKANEDLNTKLETAEKGLSQKIDSEKEKRHALEIVASQLLGDNREFKAKVAALESNTLTKPIFDMAMGAQNKTLDTQTKMLERHDARLSALVEDVVGHEEQLRKRSSANLPAMRTPIPRTDSERPRARADGPSQVVEPYVPPAMRPKLKSQQIK